MKIGSLGRFRSLVVVSAVALLPAGCFFDDAPSVPLSQRDFAMAPADLSAAVMDLSVAPDQAAPLPDLVTPADEAVEVDLYPGDGPPCLGGYLNSNDPGACPLSCSRDVRPIADEGAIHVPFCTPMKYQANPPASGNHWPFPAPWGIASDIVPREWWVHNLEHQGIVLLYNCPYPKPDGGAPQMSHVLASESCVVDGGEIYPNEMERVDNCQNEIAQLINLYNKHPQDNFYDLLFEVRMIVTQDPLLPTRFAAVAWDWAWTGNQLDLPAIECFIAARYGRGPEAAP